MKFKDFFRTTVFKIKNRKRKILIDKGTMIKRSFLEGKNILGLNNDIVNSYIGYGTYIGSSNKIGSVKIGKYCSISSNLSVILGSHPVKKNVSTHPAFFLAKYKHFRKIDLSYVKNDKYDDSKLIDNKWNLVIGNDVWIGSDVKILQGINIGDGAVIGTGAIVTKDVEAYSIVGGIPAKLIRKRFDEDKINFLLKLQWWDKTEEWIKNYAEDFEDIDILRKSIDKLEKES